MALGTDVKEMGWDLSLRAQSRRALAMNSVWLREEEDEWRGNKEKIPVLGHRARYPGRSLGQNKNIDPILGFNLGGQSSICKNGDTHMMDHDLQDRVLIAEERKKKARG
ncbi:hypothetical protein Gogos_005462 [Gossypium gossypioides]|uniref:Uncharacterized protein n=1 Tax=Gossypium gossypioides TaxID=34282 RepID=A0A7J9D605_GOSGO|nr:hypothetical protein [Gossypium gossypioides]